MDFIAANEEELNSLRKFKAIKEKEELVAKVDAIASRFTSLDMSEIDVVKTRVLNNEITTDEFERELYYLVGVKTLETKANYTASEPVGATVKIMPIAEEEICDQYGGLLKKHNLV